MLLFNKENVMHLSMLSPTPRSMGMGGGITKGFDAKFRPEVGAFDFHVFS